MESKNTYRIAVGGYRIECSEFTPHRSGPESFRMERSDELLAAYPWVTGDSSRLKPKLVEAFGPIDKIEGLDMVPLLQARALPGGTVTRAFFDEWETEFFDKLAAAHAEKPLDALLLDIHGASSVEGLDDAEGHVAARARELLGEGVIIAAPMDPHGNVSDQIFDACDILSSYRTAPHIDPPWTIYRAVRCIISLLEHPGKTLYKAKANVPILLPGEKTSTEVEPGKSLYAGLSKYNVGEDVLDCSIWMGFPWADQARCHGAVAAYGYDEAAVDAAAQTTAQAFWDRVDKFEFVGPTDTIESSVAAALASDVKPFFLSDMGDNPGAGGTDDSTVLLAYLLDQYRKTGSAKKVCFASLNDAPAVEACYQAGEGAPVKIYAGAATGGISGEPVLLEGKVASLFEDVSGGKSALIALDAPASGVMNANINTQGCELKSVLGETAGNTFAPIETADDSSGSAGTETSADDSTGAFKVIVTTSRSQFRTAAQYNAAGVCFDEEDIVVVKMGYLEPDLSAAQKGWFMVLSPGAVDQDLPRLGHKNIVRPLYPFDDLPFEPDLSLKKASKQL